MQLDNSKIMKISYKKVKGLIDKKAKFILMALLLLHLVGVMRMVSPSRFISPEPIYRNDYCFHFQKAYAVSTILKQDIALWGYDPFYLAGYTVGLLADMDNKAAGIFMFLVSFLEKAVSFKLYVLLSFWLLPLVLYLATRNFGMNKLQALLVSGLSLSFWYTQFPDFIDYGMFSFVFVSYLSVYVVSLFYKYMEKGGALNFLSLALFSSIIFYIHIFAFLILLVPCTSVYLINIKKLSFKKHFTLILLIFIIIILNSPWLFPVFKYTQFSKAATINNAWQSGVVKLVSHSFFNMKYIFRNLLLFLGIMGLIFWKKQDDKSKFWIFFPSFAFLFIISYFGSYIRFFAALGPLRFMHPLVFFSLLPASLSISQGINLAAEHLSKREAIVIAIIIFIMVSPFLLSPISAIILPNRIGEPLPDKGYALIDWIKDNTDNTGRILIELSGNTEIYFNTHLPSMLSVLCSRQFIGGPWFGTSYHDVSFSNFCFGRIFGRPIEEFSAQNIKKYLEIYNIHWIIAWSDESKALFSSRPDMYPLSTQIDKFSIYRVPHNSSFFLKGTGKINVAYNRIEVSDASQRELILKYHYIRTLKVDPPLPIESFRVLDDAIGFIKVKNGEVSNFTIYNEY
jgi:hypothetical protein